MGKEFIVSQNGEGDYSTISEAIENAEVGTKIYVKPGSYEERININKDIELIGDKEDKPQVYIEKGTVCSVDANAKISFFEFFNTDYSTPEEEEDDGDEEETFALLNLYGNAEINNCIIRQSASIGIGLLGSDHTSIISKCSISECNFAGIYTINNSTITDCNLEKGNYALLNVTGKGNPIVENCEIHDCNGDGILLEDDSTGTYRNCNLYGNNNYNILVLYGSNPTVEHCEIHNSVQCGIGIRANSLGTYINCNIYENGKLNILADSGSNPTLESCNIYGSKEAGIAILNDSTGTYSNCRIYENTASNIVLNDEANPIFEKCEIYNSEQSGIMIQRNSTGTYSNCNIYGNKSSNIVIYDEANPLVKDCEIHNSGEYGIEVADSATGTYTNCNIYENAYYRDDNFLIQNGILMEYYGDGEDVDIPLSIIKINENVFSWHDELKTITIPESVTTIGKGAFYGCSNLKTIMLSNNITIINDNAFCRCGSLETISIPSSVTYLGNEVFSNCENLKTIILPDNLTMIGASLFSRCSSLESIALPKCVTNIGFQAFAYCENLKTITLPEQLCNLGYEAFIGCSSLESITLPSGVTKIGEGTFEDCENLTTVTLPSGITSIGDDAFNSCSSLEILELPKSVTKLNVNAFWGCCNLKEINVDKDNNAYSSIDGVVYDKVCTEVIFVPKLLETISFPKGITSIGTSAFSRCSELKIINVPEGVVSIGHEAFVGCSSLETINLPKSLNVFDGNVFADCTSLTSINVDSDNQVYASINGILYNKERTEVIAVPSGAESIKIPFGVITIGKEAFHCCRNLQNISLSNSVTTIDKHAFEECTNLEIIDIPSSVTTIGEYAFYACGSLNKILLPNSITNIGDNAFGLCSSIETMDIPLGITTIGKSIFEGCYSLKAISLPESIICIPDYAFQDCEMLETIDIPSSVTTIGEGAFSGCNCLNKILLPNSIANIKKNAFQDCKSLETIRIPSGVTTIGGEAFLDCNSLETIVLPNTLTEIKDDLFGYYENTLIIDLSKYNPNQFGLEIRNRLLSSNLSSLMDNIDLESENYKAWINYFRSNVDLYYDELMGNETLLQFLMQYKCLLLEDVIELINRAEEEGLTDVKDVVLTYEQNNFTKDEQELFENSENVEGDAHWKQFRLVQYEGEDFLTIAKYKGEDTYIEVPKSINGVKIGRIGEYAFSPNQEGIDFDTELNRMNITIISIPDSVSEIARGAFNGCINIISLELPNNKIRLAPETFDEISHELPNLESFIIPEGISAIGDSAFANYEKLTSITIPSTVTKIGSCIFTNCEMLENITISKDNKDYYILDSVLYNKDDKAIYYPESKKEACEFDNSVLTETPVILEKGTEGTIGSKGTYVLFGDWPQTIKEDNVTIDEKHRYNINGWESYKGSDGCYYVKSTANPFTDSPIDNPSFSNGKKIKSGYVFYFKLESIKWRILDTNYGGGKLLLSEMALTTDWYLSSVLGMREIDGKEIEYNNYEYSEVRAYLNGLDGSIYDVPDFRNKGFINKAFSKRAIDKIKTVTVDNRLESATFDNNYIIAKDNVCNKTKDKVFLLSVNEILKEEYGLIEDESARIRKVTDYSKVVGAGYNSNGNSNWMLRSPYSDSCSNAHYVSINADIDSYCNVSSNGLGLVVALSI